MILRALFFVALTAVLMPREPNLGLGRSSSSAWAMPAQIAHLLGESADAPQQDCLARSESCTQMPSAAGNLQDFALQRLSVLRAEIEADERARARAHAMLSMN